MSKSEIRMITFKDIRFVSLDIVETCVAAEYIGWTPQSISTDARLSLANQRGWHKMEQSQYVLYASQ